MLAPIASVAAGTTESERIAVSGSRIGSSADESFSGEEGERGRLVWGGLEGYPGGDRMMKHAGPAFR